MNTAPLIDDPSRRKEMRSQMNAMLTLARAKYEIAALDFANGMNQDDHVVAKARTEVEKLEKALQDMKAAERLLRERRKKAAETSAAMERTKALEEVRRHLKRRQELAAELIEMIKKMGPVYGEFGQARENAIMSARVFGRNAIDNGLNPSLGSEINQDKAFADLMALVGMQPIGSLLRTANVGTFNSMRGAADTYAEVLGKRHEQAIDRMLTLYANEAATREEA